MWVIIKPTFYILKSDQWMTIWWAKFDLECLLLIFIYSNSTKSLAKRNIIKHTEEKSSAMACITNAICFFFFWFCFLFCFVFLLLIFWVFNFLYCFLHKNNLPKLSSWVLWILVFLVELIVSAQCFKMFHSNTKSTKSSVRQYQVL